MLRKRSISTRPWRRTPQILAAITIAATVVGVAPEAASAATPVPECHYGTVSGGSQLDYAITWPEVSGMKYVIERKPEAGSWSWRKLSPIGSTSWFDNNSGAGNTPSEYRIRTKDSSNNYSSYVNCTPIGTPSGVALDSVVGVPNQSASDVTISWNPVDGATGYRVHRDSTQVGETSASSFTDQGVSGGHFVWKVSAIATAPDNDGVNHTWESAWSDSSTSAPGEVASVDASLDGNGQSVTVTWPTVTDANGYNVHRWDAATGVYSGYVGWSNHDDVNWPMIDPMAGQSAGVYYWTVEATAKGDVKGDQVASPDVNTASDTTRPEVPWKPTITGTSSSTVDLQLKHKGDNVGVVGFRLFRTETNQFTNPVALPDIAASVPENQPFAYTDTDAALQAGTDYWYWLKAYDAAGKYSYRSGGIKATTEPGEKYATKKIGTRWELVLASEINNPNPTVQRWESIGVRTDLDGGPGAIDADVLNDIKNQGFNTIRVVLHWDEVETGYNSYDEGFMSEVTALIDRAGVAGLDVIIDPMHLGNKAHYWIPQWAWDKAWPTNGGNQAAVGDPNDSTEVLMWDDPNNSDEDLGLTYLKYILEKYKDDETVVAMELVNEPHPTNGNAWGNTDDIANLQADWVGELRIVDPKKILIVTGYFGGFLADGSKFTAAFMTNGNPTWDNVVFTAHTYYTGIGDPAGGSDYDADDDGYGDLDLAVSSRRGSKQGTRAENNNSRGCYGTAGYVPNSPDPYTCSAPSAATRGTAVANLVEGIEAQDGVAQGAGMPLYIGEFGTHPYRYVSNSSNTGWVGWGNADMMLCDQIKALRQVNGTDRVSFSVWDLQTGGFGLYDMGNNDWNTLGDQFANTSCTG